MTLHHNVSKDKKIKACLYDSGLFSLILWNPEILHKKDFHNIWVILTINRVYSAEFLIRRISKDLPKYTQVKS